MSLFVVDVEADGPIPGPYSMVCVAAIRVDEALDTFFYGETAPISEEYDPQALAVSGVSRQSHLEFPPPERTMQDWAAWLEENSRGRPVFISDNLAFDWQWVNWYFHTYLGRNPFGYSGRRIGDLYSGLVGDMFAAQDWKNLRRTPHTHHPLDDARGNAEALLRLKEMGLKF